MRKSSAAGIFDFLGRHWLTLANGIESDLIPRTNSTVELVIRRFDTVAAPLAGPGIQS